MDKTLEPESWSFSRIAPLASSKDPRFSEIVTMAQEMPLLLTLLGVSNYIAVLHHPDFQLT